MVVCHRRALKIGMRLGKDGEARVVMQYVGKSMLEDLISYKEALATGSRTGSTSVAVVQCKPVRVVNSISTCTAELGVIRGLRAYSSFLSLSQPISEILS